MDEPCGELSGPKKLRIRWACTLVPHG